MKEYLSILFHVDDGPLKDVLNFRLEQVGVESIEDKEDKLISYFLKEDWEIAESQIIEFCSFSKILYEIEEVVEQNWNAIWEASFEPVNINDFCYVRAPFHSKPHSNNMIEIILEPKMAFGTAHHATTYMMMAEMEHLDFKGKDVFDYGCGTAILSVLAEKQGAESIYAIDIEDNAIENARYNAQINSCSKITAEQKQLNEIKLREYDIILANINKNVLLDNAKNLKKFLLSDGVLLISGILDGDEAEVIKCYEQEGFIHQKTMQKEDWKCLKFGG